MVAPSMDGGGRRSQVARECGNEALKLRCERDGERRVKDQASSVLKRATGPSGEAVREAS